jgi:hypothetical protein
MRYAKTNSILARLRTFAVTGLMVIGLAFATDRRSAAWPGDGSSPAARIDMVSTAAMHSRNLWPEYLIPLNNVPQSLVLVGKAAKLLASVR